MEDFLKLSRAALALVPDKDLWQLYGYLLSKADEYGVVTISIRSLAKENALTLQKLRTRLARLSATQLITQQAAQQITQITLCSIGKKHRPPTQQITQQATQQITQQKRAVFTPPTRDEAQAYIDKMGFHWGDADLFLDFNEQKGWRLSDGNPMKDWKAAMRNWENRWKKKYETEQRNTTDKYQARRGTAAGNHKAEDYEGTF